MFCYRFWFSLKSRVLIVLGLCFLSAYPVLGQTVENIADEQKHQIFLPISPKVVQASQQVESLLADPFLEASLVAERSVYRASEGILLRFTLTNTSGTTLYVLPWGTPFDGFKKDMFAVTTEGKKVPYIGMLVKRMAPSLEDYLVLEAGAQRSVVIDLTEGYAIQSRGKYDVSFVAPLLDVRYEPVSMRRQDGFRAATIVTLPTHFTLQETRRENWLRHLDSPGGFSNCSDSEQQEVANALQAARDMAAAASNAFQNATPTQAARYITWFGPHENSRYATVQAHFASIRSALDNQNFDWDCNPTSGCDNAFAYVYPNAPYKIYLCSGFWASSTTGTDSRPGIIIHETSHFNVVADTDDHFYFHDNSLITAQTSPALAVQNADSHEYFAENVELLPMTAVTNRVRVRFSHTSTEIGTEDLPYNSVGEGVAAVENNGVLQIEAGSERGAFSLTKPMTIQAINGSVTLGQ